MLQVSPAQVAAQPPIPVEVSSHNILASDRGMAFHFLLALIASLAHRAESVNRVFHRVSLTIYGCWLIAFSSGAISGILRMKGLG